MKVIINKLDNGYTASITEEEFHPDTGEKTGEEKQRLVYERKEDLITKLTEIL